jgi:hypothetical protein
MARAQVTRSNYACGHTLVTRRQVPERQVRAGFQPLVVLHLDEGCDDCKRLLVVHRHPLAQRLGGKNADHNCFQVAPARQLD